MLLTIANITQLNHVCVYPRDIVELLLSSSATLFVSDSVSRRTPLHAAGELIL